MHRLIPAALVTAVICLCASAWQPSRPELPSAPRFLRVTQSGRWCMGRMALYLPKHHGEWVRVFVYVDVHGESISEVNGVPVNAIPLCSNEPTPVEEPES
jgi:hypothetical protein